MVKKFKNKSKKNIAILVGFVQFGAILNVLRFYQHPNKWEIKF